MKISRTQAQSLTLTSQVSELLLCFNIIRENAREIILEPSVRRDEVQDEISYQREFWCREKACNERGFTPKPSSAFDSMVQALSLVRCEVATGFRYYVARSFLVRPRAQQLPTPFTFLATSS